MAKYEPITSIDNPSVRWHGSAPQPPDDEESADLFDYGLLRDYLTYVLGAIRRHKVVGAAAFSSVMALVIVMLLVLPKTYEAEAKLLAQKNQVIASLGNPGRVVPWDSDMPTRAATETVLRHDNLVSLARQTNLVDHWNRTRAPAVRLKDWLSGLFGHKPTEEEKLSAVVGLLDKRLSVSTGENTVTISIQWPNAQMAARLVEAAQQNFLEARHVSETSAISEAISILEGHAEVVRERVEQAAEQLQKVMPEARATPSSRTERAATTKPAAHENQEVARLKVMLEAKRRTMRDLEESRERRLSELQAKLAEQRTIYSDRHPVIVDLRQQIDGMGKQQSLQIASLHEDEQALMQELSRLGATQAADDASSNGRIGAMSGEILRLERQSARNESPAVESAKDELHFQLAKYATLLDRIDAATMELDAARAAFKYRYSVLRPAEVPRSPRKPNNAIMLMVGVVLGSIMWVVAALVTDLRRGRIVERWQIERQLGLPVLAEVASS